MEEQIGVTLGHLNTKSVEYYAETADIRVVHPHRGPTPSKPVETGDQQGQLNDLQSSWDLQKQASKHGRGQSECTSRDVHQTEDKRLIELRDRVETRKLDKQVGKGSRKVLGLQEYWDH